MLVNDFVLKALTDKYIVLFESHFKRNYIHVRDVSEVFVRMLQNFNFYKGEVFNVGNNQQISIMELAKKVIEITGSKSTIEKIAYEKAYPQGFEDMQRRVPDISKIKQVLGWAPEINLDQIIKDIAAFNTK